MDAITKLKAELWRRFGTPEHPAEWDGYNYGGGKLSQRYWEYFEALELLNPDRASVILDIGGGSPKTGVGFFSSLLSTVAQKMIIMDPNIQPTAVAPANIEFVRIPADYDSVKALLASHPEITHITSISVFEHVHYPVREGIIRAINETFRGRTFVATFEYHASIEFLAYGLTARTLSNLFKPLTNFFPDRITSSPVGCEMSYEKDRIFRFNFKGLRQMFGKSNIPRWYPVVVRFVRMP